MDAHHDKGQKRSRPKESPSRRRPAPPLPWRPGQWFLLKAAHWLQNVERQKRHNKDDKVGVTKRSKAGGTIFLSCFSP